MGGRHMKNLCGERESEMYRQQQDKIDKIYV